MYAHTSGGVCNVILGGVQCVVECVVCTMEYCGMSTMEYLALCGVQCGIRSV